MLDKSDREKISLFLKQIDSQQEYEIKEKDKVKTFYKNIQMN